MRMSETKKLIPHGWDSQPIGALVTEQLKSNLNVSDATGEGKYPFFTSGEVVLRHSDNLVNGENLYLADGGVAEVKFYNGPAAYSNHTYVLKAKKQIVEGGYLYAFLDAHCSNVDYLYFQGTGLKNLQKKDFKSFPVLYPKDRSEQQRIVQLLTCLDEAIAKTEALIEKYRRIKQGMMHDLLTNGIDKDGNIRSPKTHRFKPSPLGMIPEEWECVELGSLYNLRSGTTPNRSVSKYFDPEGILWVKTLDLNETYISDTEEKISDFALETTSLSVQPSGAVLVAMYGGWQQIGRTGILEQPATTNQAIVSLTQKQGTNLLSEYTQYFLQTYRRCWKCYAVSTRKDPNISKEDVMEFKISYPLDSEEQSIICKRINEFESYINDQVATARKLKKIRKGLLNDLLTGKVRIPETVNI